VDRLRTRRKQLPRAPDHRRALGRRGEDVAATYLADLGFEIVGRNVRTRYGELDIVAREGESLVFVEVRSRGDDRLGSPEESVDARKQAKLVALAEGYLATLPEPPSSCRIDVVVVEIRAGVVRRLELIRNAVQA
jgi:putative endonuclease